MSGCPLNEFVPGCSPPSCCARSKGRWGCWTEVWSLVMRLVKYTREADRCRRRCASYAQSLRDRASARWKALCLRAVGPPSLPLMLSLRACARRVAHSGTRVRDRRAGNQVTLTCRALSLAFLKGSAAPAVPKQMPSYMHLKSSACGMACLCLASQYVHAPRKSPSGATLDSFGDPPRPATCTRGRLCAHACACRAS